MYWYGFPFKSEGLWNVLMWVSPLPHRCKLDARKIIIDVWTEGLPATRMNWLSTPDKHQRCITYATRSPPSAKISTNHSRTVTKIKYLSSTSFTILHQPVINHLSPTLTDLLTRWNPPLVGRSTRTNLSQRLASMPQWRSDPQGRGEAGGVVGLGGVL